mmetsp:Transcript_21639/g.19195  ORF Transcript_21639/g.19195 Transcript_21639/m.19195 type:complete len:137 (+) Transcript_21639:14-424(+)
MWNDSECTVEEEYSSSITTRTLNTTNQFRNILGENKGRVHLQEDRDIKLRAAKLRATKAKSHCQFVVAEQESPNITTSFDGTIYQEKIVRKVSFGMDSPVKQISMPTDDLSWANLCKKKQRIDSSRILLEIRSRKN